MKRYQIINIQEIVREKPGVAYQGEIGVFVPSDTSAIYLAEGLPVYVNAFSYLLALHGKARLVIDETEYEILPGCLCLLSPLHLTCFSEVSNDFRCMFLCLHKDFVDRIGVFNLKQRIAKGMHMHRNPSVQMSAADTVVLKESIENIRNQILRQDHLYHLELMQNALIRFYLELDNILDRNIQPEGSGMTVTRNRMKLQEFITLLMNHFKEEHQVAFYAKAMHITPQYLTAIVKAQTGKTVNAFVYELIYSEVRNLLVSTDLSIQQITARLNFADQASFSKFFKRHAGVSPQIFREEAGKI